MNFYADITKDRRNKMAKHTDKRVFKNTGNTLRNARTKAGVSQSQLAKMLGYKNAQYISNIERGMCAFPYEAIVKTCEIIGLNVESLKLSIVQDHIETIDNFIVNDISPQYDDSETITYAGGLI
jgi:transcriptional regulator with XRE-family HTH domain